MNAKKAFSGVPLIVMFLAICLSPWIDTLFKVDATASLSENRRLAAIPKFPSDIPAFNRFPGDLNNSFNDHFGFRRFLIQTHGGIMMRVLKTSPNPEVVLGSDDWLFFEPDVRYLTSFGGGDFISVNGNSSNTDTPFIGKKANPREAIMEFDRQLRERNIRLIVLPVPVKTMFYSEKISPSFHAPTGYLQNPAYSRFIKDLEKENILVADITDVLAEIRKTSPKPIFLRTDSHWSPETMTAAAESIASYIERHADLSMHNSGKLKMRQMEVTNIGDLANMLPINGDSNSEYAEKATIRQIVTNESEPWVSDGNAEILFLGDSFANIYSSGDLGWGESAGLVEQLSFLLSRPVDRICQNDNGAFATRLALQRELSRGRDRLKNKKVVVWEFAVRELVTGDWKTLDMKLGGEKSGVFFTPGPGKEATISGVIDAISEKPIPGKSPYKDHVMSFHLVDVTIAGNAAGMNADENNDALVYILSMKDNTLTAAANFSVGQTITVRVSNWYDVADTYGGINRSEIDDENLMSADPCWGEEIIK